VRTAEGCKAEGNSFAAKNDWQEAERLYCEGLEKLDKITINSECSMPLLRLALLSYRAQANLELGEWKAALDDANEALQLDADHTKSRVRKAKALHHLER
jgi:tetratricopeptide (TPR) repeat protein